MRNILGMAAMMVALSGMAYADAPKHHKRHAQNPSAVDSGMRNNNGAGFGAAARVEPRYIPNSSGGFEGVIYKGATSVNNTMPRRGNGKQRVTDPFANDNL